MQSPQDGSGGSPVENRSAKVALEKKSFLSTKMQSFTKMGLLKTLGSMVGVVWQKAVNH